MSKSKRQTKFIFVTGGVVSSLGKGVASASIGTLLEMRGLRISMTKMDPYINVDPGTISPYQHGEVFVTDDGTETDLDLGHYSRFTKAVLSEKNSFTAGKIYESVIKKERQGDYLGGTIQVIPHITDQIKNYIYTASEGVDISIVEVGGTVGDIESLPFLEAVRQLRLEHGANNVLCIHLTLIPYIAAADEIKTKPTQHSVQKLREIGVQPDILICRTEKSLSTDIKQKISLFCNVRSDCVIEANTTDNIYKIPLLFNGQGLDDKIIDLLGMWTAAPNAEPWKQFINRCEFPKNHVTIALVGKYTGLKESYKSVTEALTHAGVANDTRVNIRYINSETLTPENLASEFYDCSGILLPGGFGCRGIEGMILATQYARTHKIPFLGICLGLQMACIEFARNVCELNESTSEEITPQAEHLIIHYLEEQRSIRQKGGSMRLGSYPCHLNKLSLAFKIYGNQKTIHERHRHRYEFNTIYKELFETRGMIFSGMSPCGKLVEMIELKDHPWFVACQFHPEFKSSPMQPSPLFVHFVKSLLPPSTIKS